MDGTEEAEPRPEGVRAERLKVEACPPRPGWKPEAKRLKLKVKSQKLKASARIKKQFSI